MDRRKGREGKTTVADKIASAPSHFISFATANEAIVEHDKFFLRAQPEERRTARWLLAGQNAAKTLRWQIQ